MKKESYYYIRLILVALCAGLASHTAAQGIRNTGVAINISSGYVVCPGGLDNSGTVTNNGTLNIAGSIVNTAIIEGNGSILIGGNLTSDGTFNPDAGSVTFNGPEEQTISASSLITFNNLIIDGSGAGTTIAAGTMVTVSGDMFSPNGKLIIDSDALSNNGSLIYNGSAAPTGNVTYRRIMPADRYRYIASPVGATLLPAGPTFWRWNELLGAWGEDLAETPTTVCSSGIGYTVLASSNTVVFTGLVLSALMDVPATAPYDVEGVYTDDRGSWGGGGWNLLGNPFTCALDGSLFISTNSASLDDNYLAMYIYNGSDYYYIANPVSGYPGLGTFGGAENYTDIQAGQGFFVLANHDGVTFDFTGEMRKHNTSVPMTKSAGTENAWPGLQLKVKYGDKVNSTLIVYNENMISGLDPGYDIGLLSTSPEVSIYSTLVEKDNNVNFTRQALPLSGCEKNIIPVGIDSEKGGEVTFSAFTVPLGNFKFWLEDRKTGIFTNLNASTYTVSLPAQTYGTGRFFIYASTNMPTGTDSPAADNGQDMRIWTSDDKVIIRGDVSDKAKCAVYNMQGLQIIETRLADGEQNTVTMPSGSTGVYLVRVIDGKKVYTTKVVFL